MDTGGFEVTKSRFFKISKKSIFLTFLGASDFSENSTKSLQKTLNLGAEIFLKIFPAENPYFGSKIAIFRSKKFKIANQP